MKKPLRVWVVLGLFLVLGLGAVPGHAQVKPTTRTVAKPKQTLRGNLTIIHGIAVRPDGKQVAACGIGFDKEVQDFGQVKVWDIGTGTVALTLEGRRGTVHRSVAEAAPLARLVREKTGGNPFFVIHFLTGLYSKGLITFDRAAGRWTWDMARVRA